MPAAARQDPVWRADWFERPGVSASQPPAAPTNAPPREVVVPGSALPAWPRSTDPIAEARNAPAGRPIGGPPPATAAPGRTPTQRTPGMTSAAPFSAPPAASGAYDRPREQRAGTTYGGTNPLGAGHMTMALPTRNSAENTSSLTGHILSTGRSDGPTPKSNTTKVLLIGVLLLALLVILGLIVATLAGDAVTALFGGIVDG
jgi:hypothetical protein